MTMEPLLNLLLVEDSPEDAQLILLHLDREGVHAEYRRVDTEATYIAALDSPPDLILSDFAMPRFNGLRALRILKDRGLDIPFILVSGTIGERTLERAPGHRAQLRGRRLAQRWRWAHASLPDGRWAHALAAKLPGLPELAQHGSERGGPGLPLARSSAAGTAWTIGPYAIDADPASFVRLDYRDADGSAVHCYHSPRARLAGPGIASADASYELASRVRLPELEP